MPNTFTSCHFHLGAWTHDNKGLSVMCPYIIAQHSVNSLMHFSGITWTKPNYYTMPLRHLACHVSLDRNCSHDTAYGKHSYDCLCTQVITLWVKYKDEYEYMNITLTHVHTRARAHTHMHTHTRAHTHAHAHTHAQHTHAHTRARAHTHTHTRARTHTHSTHAHTHARAHTKCIITALQVYTDFLVTVWGQF